MDPTTLTALSPLDGRYARKAAPLRQYLSEYALIKYRTLIEVRWLQHLADEPALDDLKPLDSPLKDVLNEIIVRNGASESRPLLEKMSKKLRLHMQIEETIVYPAANRCFQGDLSKPSVLQSFEEHELAGYAPVIVLLDEDNRARLRPAVNA